MVESVSRGGHAPASGVPPPPEEALALLDAATLALDAVLEAVEALDALEASELLEALDAVLDAFVVLGAPPTLALALDADASDISLPPPPPPSPLEELGPVDVSTECGPGGSKISLWQLAARIIAPAKIAERALLWGITGMMTDGNA
jgi:hypothetical protein